MIIMFDLEIRRTIKRAGSGRAVVKYGGKASDGLA